MEHIREIIVVEGIHDKQAVQRVVDADVWVVGGDRIANNFLLELERASRTRGVIILTDPDGPGERIRRRISQRIPGCKHAFLPKQDALGAGGVGVEHAANAAILRAILHVRPEFEQSSAPALFTMEDLTAAGLAGGPHSAEFRDKLGSILRIGTGNAKAFLRKLNVLGISREEWEEALNLFRRDCSNE